MGSWRAPDDALERLYRRAEANRWSTPRHAFADALERSARRAFQSEPSSRDVERHAEGLHLQDLALACACAAGVEPAWEHFVREFRPVLYRAADALDPTGGARELADSLYGELFGLLEREGRRRSHFDYFHGRSSLATWLRAVLTQRHIDRLRGRRRLEPLPEEDGPGAPHSTDQASDPRRQRYLAVMRRAVATAVAALPARDRIRLNCYYAESLTLAQIGRTLGEHEATVSRHLTRSRRAVRDTVAQCLRAEEGMGHDEIQACFSSVVEDAGPLNLSDWFDTTPPRKKDALNRSK